MTIEDFELDKIILDARCNNHGWFDSNTGVCRCLPGYRGTHCGALDCVYGHGDYDWYSGLCICRSGYKGLLCQYYCVNGYVSSGICFCHRGYTGRSCEFEESKSSRFSYEDNYSSVVFIALGVILAFIALVTCFSGYRRSRLRRINPHSQFRSTGFATASGSQLRPMPMTSAPGPAELDSHMLQQFMAQLPPPPPKYEDVVVSGFSAESNAPPAVHTVAAPASSTVASSATTLTQVTEQAVSASGEPPPAYSDSLCPPTTLNCTDLPYQPTNRSSSPAIISPGFRNSDEAPGPTSNSSVLTPSSDGGQMA